MNRKEVKSFLHILQAFADGKEIECREEDKWYKVLEICNEMNPQDYRIKPEPKCRPFKDAEECWHELLKHKPFGWVKDTESNEYLNVYCISNSASSIDLFGRMFKRCIFIDGSPFGIKVEENI